MSIGAIYIITQDSRYVDMLLVSAASLKRAMPGLSITVFSQFPVKGDIFDQVVTVEPTIDGFYDKTILMSRSPYDRTLFLDADTYVLEPVPELFKLLDKFDCAASHEEYLSTDWFKKYLCKDIPASFPEFNTGVLAFRSSDKMLRILHHWGELYRKYLQQQSGEHMNDQPFFREAVYGSDIRIATLSREYNCKYRGQGYLNGRVKVLHGHVEFRLKPQHVNRAAAVLNASVRPRVYIAGKVVEQKIVGRLIGHRKGRVVGRYPEPPESLVLQRARRFKELIAERGIQYTLTKVLTSMRNFAN